MYETHFGFHRQPFQSADASRAFFVSESIHSILPQLLHALRSDLGIAVVTGPPGSGKTSLLRHVQRQLANEGRTLVCSGASLATSADLMAVLLQASRMKAGSSGLMAAPDECSRTSAPTRSLALEQMKRTAELWGPVLLLIDDAQLMSLPILNELRSYTEEEWNGRGLVHCLVSAPISFEEQLARAEYAEFGRRIRCLAFLQPLKSGEAIRFLQQQIELVGGTLSHVFSTNALELITAAANGIPRCLSLLADESLVVAAEIGELQATDQSVRTALGRLQHLQYNWNASPLAASADVPTQHSEDDSNVTGPDHESDEEYESDTAAVSTVRRALPPTAVRAKQTPAHETLSPGVIEFGGSAVNSVIVPAVTPATIPSPEAVQSAATAPPASDLEEEVIAQDLGSPPFHPAHDEISPVPSSDAKAPFPSPQFVEFSGTPKTQEADSAFEVGHRFEDESPTDSVSIEEVDGSEIFDLFHFSSEREVDSNENLMPLHSPGSADPTDDPNCEFFGQDVIWIDHDADTNTRPDRDPMFTDAATGSLASESLAKRDDPKDEAPDRSSRSCFMNLMDFGLSNRTPVFDRFTSIALGRDVPSGLIPIASLTRAKPLMLADYGMMAMKQSIRRGLPPVARSRIQSLAPITITMTTDSNLIAEFATYSPSREAGLFVLFQNMPGVESDSAGGCFETERCEGEAPAESSVVSVSAWQEPRPPGFETISNQAIRCDASVTESGIPMSVSPGLKLWQDGQLIFTPSMGDSAADTSEQEPQQGSLNTESADVSVQLHGATADVSNPSDILFRPGPSGFFTLPLVAENVELDPSSSGAEDDEDILPIVESIADIRADMQHFHRPDANPGIFQSRSVDAAGTNSHAKEPEGLLSQAERRLKSDSAVDDSTPIALQMQPAAEKQKATNAAISSDRVLLTSGNPVGSPQFSRLFTRLWENRKRAVHCTENEGGCE